jgi:hypothetical protein
MLAGSMWRAPRARRINARAVQINPSHSLTTLTLATRYRLVSGLPVDRIVSKSKVWRLIKNIRSLIPVELRSRSLFFKHSQQFGTTRKVHESGLAQYRSSCLRFRLDGLAAVFG